MEGHQAQACLEVEVPALGLVFLALKVLVGLTALAAEVWTAAVVQHLRPPSCCLEVVVLFLC